MMRVTVLVVDDEEPVHHMVKQHLPECHLIHAYNSWEATSILENEKVNVVILDINMPGKNGFQLLGDIRSRSERPRVIMFSSDMSHQTVRNATKQGADDFVGKTLEGYRSLDSHVRAMPPSRLSQQPYSQSQAASTSSGASFPSKLSRSSRAT